MFEIGLVGQRPNAVEAVEVSADRHDRPGASLGFIRLGGGSSRVTGGRAGRPAPTVGWWWAWCRQIRSVPGRPTWPVTGSG